jgi:hypothetical protein
MHVGENSTNRETILRRLNLQRQRCSRKAFVLLEERDFVFKNALVRLDRFFQIEEKVFVLETH